MVGLISKSASKPVVVHGPLCTTFSGIEHPSSTQNLAIHQFSGIKYARIPGRFRQSKIFTAFASDTDATKHGYSPSPTWYLTIWLMRFRAVCPQLRHGSFEADLLGELEADLPKQTLKQSEFDCLNLSITRPSGCDRQSHLPVMVWFHGYVSFNSVIHCSNTLIGVGLEAPGQVGCMILVPSSIKVLKSESLSLWLHSSKFLPSRLKATHC